MGSSQILHFLLYSTIFYSSFIALIDATIFLVAGIVYCHENQPYVNGLLHLYEEDFGRKVSGSNSIEKKIIKNPHTTLLYKK